MPNSPEWSLAIGSQRTFYFDNGMTLTPRVDYFTQGEMFARTFNRSIDRIDGWSMMNLSATISPEEGNWQLKAYMQNVLDDDNVTGHYFTDPTSGNFTNVFVLDPRMYGLSLNVKF